MRYLKALFLLSLATLAGCQTAEVELTEDPVLREQLIYGDEASVRVVQPLFETTPVLSLDDAADDPAIWVHPKHPAQSLIFGTDKKSGLAVYNLQGQQVQFIKMGLPNNVDIRQNVTVGGWQGDIAAASNRDGDMISFFSVTSAGAELLGNISASLPEPYGFCLGVFESKLLAWVTYKTGEVVVHHVQHLSGGISAPVIGEKQFASQLEGCVMDDSNNQLYVGEEGTGIWSATVTWKGDELSLTNATSVDRVGSASGIIADIEGLTLYEGDERDFLIASSQGNDSYAVYDASSKVFLGRFRIGATATIDGSQETDGIAVTSASLGEDFPEGMLVVQDGFNGEQAQNFKLVSWQTIRTALDL